MYYLSILSKIRLQILIYWYFIFKNNEVTYLYNLYLSNNYNEFFYFFSKKYFYSLDKESQYNSSKILADLFQKLENRITTNKISKNEFIGLLNIIIKESKLTNISFIMKQ